MTLQQLRYVTTVAETGTISGAAKALFISQPSLTAAIQELEKEMGITIFLRTNRGVVLSREGDEFLGYARQVLMQAELLEDRYGAQSSHRQQFAVSAQHYNFAARVFARVVRDMGGERYSMTFRETTTYEVIEDVGRMRSEVGVLVMTEQNGEVLRRLFREYELTYTELVQKDATVYVDKTAKAEDRPGVTRSKQWVPVDRTLELLDTPGILWPKFDDVEVGKRLAFTGAIKDDVMDIEELACYLMEYLGRHYADILTERYKIDVEEGDMGYDLLTKAGRKRGFLMRGAEVDTERMARILLDEFRGGKLGRFTLETVEEPI